jgi:hypothetical protein
MLWKCYYPFDLSTPTARDFSIQPQWRIRLFRQGPKHSIAGDTLTCRLRDCTWKCYAVLDNGFRQPKSASALADIVDLSQLWTFVENCNQLMAWK